MEARIGWRDASIPVLVLVVGVAELASLGTSGWLAAAGLEAVAAALLVLRRTAPLLAVPASAIALMGIQLTGTAMEEAATPLAVEGFDLVGDGEVLVGHGPVGDLLWRSPGSCPGCGGLAIAVIGPPNFVETCTMR